MSRERLAELLGWPANRVSAALERTPDVEYDGAGHIVGYGLTLRETPHALFGFRFRRQRSEPKRAAGLRGAFALGAPFSIAICPFCTPALIVLLGVVAATSSPALGGSAIAGIRAPARCRSRWAPGPWDGWKA